MDVRDAIVNTTASVSDAEHGKHPRQRLFPHGVKPTKVLTVSDGHGVLC